MIISIIDYGSGNIKSVSKAVEFAAQNLNKSIVVNVTSEPAAIRQSDKIILPGQGSFKQCAQHLKNISGGGMEVRPGWDPSTPKPPPPHLSRTQIHTPHTRLPVNCAVSVMCNKI